MNCLSASKRLLSFEHLYNRNSSSSSPLSLLSTNLNHKVHIQESNTREHQVSTRSFKERKKKEPSATDHDTFMCILASESHRTHPSLPTVIGGTTCHASLTSLPPPCWAASNHVCPSKHLANAAEVTDYTVGCDLKRAAAPLGVQMWGFSG